MNSVFFLVAEKTSIDSRTNSLSIFNVLESMTLQGDASPPGDQVVKVATEYQVVVRAVRHNTDVPESGTGHVRLLAPDGAELMRNEFDVDLTESSQAGVVLAMQDLPVKEAGWYAFVLSLPKSEDSEPSEAARYPFAIRFEAQASE